MLIAIGARSDAGRVRENNEDSYRVNAGLGLVVLSDGMGGGADGEVASRMAVDIITEHCQQAIADPSLPFLGEARPEFCARTSRLVSGVLMANRSIYEAAKDNSRRRGMGATIVAAWVSEMCLSLAHVGDSRVYLYRSGVLEQLTSDHSLVAEQVRHGMITVEEANSSEMQSVLTRALGMEEELEVDAEELSLMEGDALLLCSDGLTRMVSEPEIESTLREIGDVQAAADRLVELANEYGGQDNVTVVLSRIAAQEGRWFTRLGRRRDSPPARSPEGSR